jgi:hydroxymethylbilane synthase
MGFAVEANASVRTLRLGARGSLLSRMQSQWVADALEKRHANVRVELVIVKTTGDVVQDRPLSDVGGKGLFTKELELALLNREIDLAVHSYKDVPVTQPLVPAAPTELVIAAVPEREDPRDVLCATDVRKIQDLPHGAKVGSSSLRRRCQLLALRPDLNVVTIRGNIDTRLKKRRAGDYDAIVLAMAGLRRSALFDAGDMSPVGLDEILPAAAQGALAIQCRRDDVETRALLGFLDDPKTSTCVDLEREVVAALEGDCHSPIAALATIEAAQITLRVAVGKRGGEPPAIRAETTGQVEHGDVVLKSVVQSLAVQGARRMLTGA